MDCYRGRATPTEAVSLQAPLRLQRMVKPPAHLPLRWRGPNRTAMQALHAFSSPSVRHGLIVCVRKSRAARSVGGPRSSTGVARGAG